MISAVVCLNTLLNTEGRPINMDNIEHKPDTSIEQQHETGSTSSGLQHTPSQPKTEPAHQPENQNLRPTSSAGVQQTPPQPKVEPAPQRETASEAQNVTEPEPEADSEIQPEFEPKAQNVKKIEPALDKGRKVHPKTVRDELPAKSRNIGKWVAGGIITAIVAVGAWLGYDAYIRPSQKGNIDSRPVTVSPEVTKPDYAKLSEEIFTSLESSFGEFVKAGAVEDYAFCETEDDLLQKWRGRNIFMFTGSRAGFIDTDKFSWTFSDSLQPSTLEINDSGTVFQADLSGSQPFSANSLIDSAVTLVSSLKPDRFTDTQSMKRNITAYITRRLEANGANGYVRFVLRTHNEGAKLMAAYSLNPSDASQKTYLVLNDNFMGFDGRTLRNIEDSINVMSDINAVSFTMRKGRVESYDSLTDCLRKFVKSFAK